MNTNNYLPFDLETALKHPERVVTRDGRKVEQLVEFKPQNDKLPVYGLLDGEIESWSIDGVFRLNRIESNCDLFLLPEVKECWLNIYVWKSNGEFAVVVNNSQEEANTQKGNGIDLYTFIKTIRVTNQPE